MVNSQKKSIKPKVVDMFFCYCVKLKCKSTCCCSSCATGSLFLQMRMQKKKKPQIVILHCRCICSGPRQRKTQSVFNIFAMKSLSLDSHYITSLRVCLCCFKGSWERKCFLSEVSSLFTLGYPSVWPQL